MTEDESVLVAQDVRELADVMAQEAEDYLGTVTEVAAGSNPEQALPLLLLAVSDVLAAGARLGATTDVVPIERFEPDTGPDPDVDPLRDGLVRVFDGIDDYVEVVDPLLGPEVVASTLSGSLAAIAQALSQGLAHHRAGRVSEALWWWQFSYLSDWGERGSSALRTLQTILAHLRLDVDEDVAAEAEFEALH